VFIPKEFPPKEAAEHGDPLDFANAQKLDVALWRNLMPLDFFVSVHFRQLSSSILQVLILR
jgi:hypothetical protein